MPGPHAVLKLEADKPGTYLGQCAEYCGLSHANMRLRVIAQTEADYEAWVAEPAGSRSPQATARRVRRRHSTQVGLRDLPLVHERPKTSAHDRPEPHPPRRPRSVRGRHLPDELRQPLRSGSTTRRAASRWATSSSTCPTSATQGMTEAEAAEDREVPAERHRHRTRSRTPECAG